MKNSPNIFLPGLVTLQTVELGQGWLLITHFGPDIRLLYFIVMFNDDGEASK